MEFSRRRLLQAAGAAVASGAVPAMGRGSAAVAGQAERPNIVWFRSEDNSACFVGAYGMDPLAVTPTIDGLARDGVLFENYFTTSPVCAPGKLGILTGLYEDSLGPGHHMRADGKVPDWCVGFATYLQRVGYWTTEQGSPKANPDHNTSMTRTGYDDTSGDWTKRPVGKPFFALLGTTTSHETNAFDPAPGATDPAKVRLPAYHPESDILRRDRAHYMDQVTKMDGEVATCIQKLKDEGLWDNTIFIYASDHGGVLPRSKRFCYDSGLHAPLVIRFPDRWRHLAPAPPGSVYRPPVSAIDMTPTILAWGGAKLPSYLHGHQFAGPGARPRIYAFSNRNRMDESIDFVRTVRDRRYRYIRNYLPHIPYGQHVQFMWLQAGVREWERQFLAGETDEVQSRFWQPKPAEELYDLRADPDEVVNLIDAPQHQARVAAMRRALDRHMIEINDNGFIPEGMSAEGYEASRKPGAFPIRRVMDLAALAIRRRAKHRPTFVQALADHNEVVRYWGALGLSMLDAKAAPAANVLAKAMTRDASPWVRAQAADALTRAGLLDDAMPYLASVVVDLSQPMSVRLQAVWSLARLGPQAASTLPQLTAASVPSTAGEDYPSQAARYAVRVVSGTYVPAP